MAMQPEIDPQLVTDSGFAFLRAGEIVIPKPGSEALFTSLRDDGSLVIEFPVEVEVRVVEAGDPEQYADVALQRLLHALDGIA